MKKRCFYVISYMAYYVSYCLVTKSDSFATLKRRSVGCQALLSTGFPRQVYWSGLPFSSPRDLPYREVSQVVESVAEWLCGKESAYQCRRLGFNPWIRKIPWRKKWQPIPVFLPRAPRTVELGRLQSRGSQRVRHDLARTHTCKLYFIYTISNAHKLCKENTNRKHYNEKIKLSDLPDWGTKMVSGSRRFDARTSTTRVHIYPCQYKLLKGTRHSLFLGNT